MTGVDLRDALILLPTSEGKSPDGDPSRSWGEIRSSVEFNSFNPLDRHRLAAIKRLWRATSEMGLRRREKLLECKGRRLEQAVALNKTVLISPTMHASERYTGVMFSALAYQALPSSAKKHFDENAIIVCGLFGLMRPTDLVPDYKVPIAANIGRRVGSLTGFWRKHASPAVKALASGRVVLNLLPKAQGRIWAAGGSSDREVTFRFVKIKDGKARSLAHASKHLRGLLIRRILAEEVTSTDDLQSLNLDGYSLDPGRTEDDGRHISLTLVASGDQS